MTSKHDVHCIYPFVNENCEKSLSIVKASDEAKSNYVQYYKNDNMLTGTRSGGLSAPVIYKLHGSINYFAQQEDNGNSLMVSDDVGNGTFDIGNSKRWKKGLPAILAVDSIWSIRNRYGRSVVPMTIPPTYAKLTGHTWLRQIWKDAMDALGRANKIIFIGYSFPESDGFMRAMLHGAMTLRITKQLPKVYVIDPNESTHLKFNELFGDMIQKLTCQSFSESIKTGTLYEILKNNDRKE
jgi:hypothetical protein